MEVVIKKCGERKMVNGKKTEITLVTTSTCYKCPAAKKWLDDNKIKYTLLVADANDKNMSIADSFNITSVPAIVVDNKKVYSFEEYKKNYI